MKVLVIDNNLDRDCWGSSDICSLIAKASHSSTIYVRRAPQSDLPPSPLGFDRIVVSGSKNSCMDSSPWVGSLTDFIKKTLDAGVPFLGICYGHQMLVRAVGGTSYLRKAKTPEFGWTEIQLLKDSALTKNLPSKFYSFSAHFEEVTLPPSFDVLASSRDCSVQACQVIGKAAFGLQFHPEKPLAETQRILAQRKKAKSPKYLLLPNQGDRLYDATIGETLVTNFLQLDLKGIQ